MVITSLNVVSRPELMHGVATRKDSIGEEKEPAQKATGKKEKSKGGFIQGLAQEGSFPWSITFLAVIAI